MSGLSWSCQLLSRLLKLGEWFVVELEVEGVLDMGCEEFGMGGG